MAEGHGRDQWGRLSVLLALTANCHRDPKKGRAYKPSDFDPHTKIDGRSDPEAATRVDDETGMARMRKAFTGSCCPTPKKSD